MLMKERHAHTSGVLSRTSLKNASQPAGTHGLKNALGLKPQVGGDEARIDTDRVTYNFDGTHAEPSRTLSRVFRLPAD